MCCIWMSYITRLEYHCHTQTGSIKRAHEINVVLTEDAGSSLSRLARSMKNPISALRYWYGTCPISETLSGTFLAVVMFQYQLRSIFSNFLSTFLCRLGLRAIMGLDMDSLYVLEPYCDFMRFLISLEAQIHIRLTLLLCGISQRRIIDPFFQTELSVL